MIGDLFEAEIRHVYIDVLQRDADPEAITEYSDKLAEGLISLEELETSLRASKEYTNRTASALIWNTFFDQQLPIRFPSHQRRLPASSDRFAVLVEPRCDRRLQAVVNNVLTMLGMEWGLQVFHGTDNEDFVRRELAHIENVNYVNLNIPNLTPNQYRKLVTSAQFWSTVKGVHVLYFQTDALLRRPGIDQFLDYDYIGAPWVNTNEVSGTRVGNGGLSIRNRQAMLDISRRHSNPGISPDVFFSKFCHREGFRIANAEIAESFSVENVFHPDPLGLHKAWFELHPNQVRCLLENVNPPILQRS